MVTPPKDGTGVSVRKGMCQSNRLERLLCIVLLVGLFSFLMLHFALDSRKSLRIILYSTFMLPVLLYMLSGAVRDISISRYYFPLLGLFATALVISASHGMESFLGSLEPVFILMLFLAGLDLIVRRASELLQSCLLIFAIFSLVWGIWALFVWSDAYFLHGEVVRVSLAGAGENPIHASLIILFGILYGWLFRIEPLLQGAPAWLRSLAWLVVLALILSLSLVFGSRSALLAVIAFVPIAWFVVERGWWLPVLSVSLLVVAFIVSWDLIIATRFDSHRIAIWRDTLVYVNDVCNIWTGCGSAERHLFAGQFRHAHSAYFSMFFQYGLIGFVALVAFIAHFLWIGFKVRSRWFALAVIGWVAVAATSSGVIVAPRPLWIYVWLPTLMTLVIWSSAMQSRPRAFEAS